MDKALNKVVVLGGYGNFGKRIVEDLAKLSDIVIYLAGRNLDKAQSLIDELEAKAHLKPLVMDINADDFAEQLQHLSPFMVIHTSGPFQGQDYHVPQACINAGSHYIDLADDRKFVCDIAQLDDKAKAADVLVVSGASSVPGLSSAVIDQYRDGFSTIDSIDMAIAPGNRAERGEATVKAILSYTGHRFEVFKEGRWQDAYGWMDSRQVDFGDIAGKRWLANVEVPDLSLFPERYQVTRAVSFQAGLELPLLHHSMNFMAWLAKIGIVKSWVPLVKPIVASSNVLISLGSDIGSMRIEIEGADIKDGLTKRLIWSLYAPDGIGPYIPTLSTIILARALLKGECEQRGAMPCVGLLKLADFDPYFKPLGIYLKQTDTMVP